jgi:hypothetical protein
VDPVLEDKNSLKKVKHLDVLFRGLEASTVAWKSLWRPKQFLEPIQPQLFTSMRIRIPNPGSQTNADPDPDPFRTLPSQKVKF